ncbi:hypothetical protein BCU83_13730 [Vibrio breoganii]|uniref:restriction endonuclease subunit S n=1 Tax=Vibrio breoganii TaxID=553239 RepID=UPI000C84B519|nr:restriction endonuclease subunit S [Vibrio breoganii]PMG79273.1 hypothetical protein BCU83_13730 [Vibrio breoganii]
MTDRYKAYPEYKDSGVEWLEDIPTHWSSKALKFLCTYNDDVINETTDPETIIEYVDIGSVSAVEGISKTEKVAFGKSPSRARRIVRNGDVIVSTVRTYLEAIAPITNPPENMIVSTGFAVIRPNSKLDKGFAAYCLRAKGFIREVVARSVGISYPAINATELVGISVPYLPYEEQQKIANFLDHETAKIDTLITKQEKLIELLKEKLLANRYHTVTKGLNPDVNFVETGISWTPLAPEHWLQVPNRSVMSMRRVLVGQNYRNYQLLSLTKKGVLVRNISSGEGKQSDHLDRTQEVRKGDLVFCLFDVEETPRTVGLSHHLGMISGDYTVFECSNPNMARFLEYFYKAMDDRKLLKPLYRGLRKRIPKPGFLRVNIPVPPKEELESILQSLDYLEERIEQLTHLADKQVTILKERKTALISAAVTGKIDVRNFKSKEQGSHNG